MIKELSRLRDKEMFEVQEFSSFVDRIREAVSLHLHNLVMVDADLKSGNIFDLNCNDS